MAGHHMGMQMPDHMADHMPGCMRQCILIKRGHASTPGRPLPHLPPAAHGQAAHVDIRHASAGKERTCMHAHMQHRSERAVVGNRIAERAAMGHTHMRV